MRYGSVCSGVEAASVAWEPLGFEPVFFSEIEPFPSAVLAHHWPDVPNHGDMTKFEEWNYESGAIDVLVGGTPCQSFSIAGMRGGLADSRGNLALTYMRMVDQLRPKWTVWENVPGVLSSGGGRDFGSIVGALDELGYSCSWRVLDAQNFGVPQRRRRVFLVGCASGDWRDPAQVLFESGCGGRDSTQSRKKRKENTESPVESVAGSLDTQCGGGKLTHQSLSNGHLLLQPQVARMRGFGDYEIDGTFSTTKARDWKDATDLVIHANNVAPAITSSGPPYRCTGNQGSEVDALVAFSSNMSVPDCRQDNKSPTLKLGGQGGGNPPAISSHKTGVRRLTPTEAERLQGFPDGHTDIGWKGKPTPDSHRYKAMGNSMAVPVMRWIGERIKEVSNG
jgi:DNA (cytosine-5)-methyltransferase 1